MLKIAAAISTSALLAVVLLLPFLTLQIEAHAAQPIAKGDRLDLRAYGAACSAQAWPYYEARCLRNAGSPRREVRPVRIVSTDRLVRIQPTESQR